MAQYDGTIRINTKIDSGGFLKGLKKMSAQSKKLNNSISETTGKIEQLQKEIKDLQNAPAGDTSAISNIKSAISDVIGHIENLKKEISDLSDAPLESSAIAKYEDAWNAADQKYMEYTRKREQLENELSASYGPNMQFDEDSLQNLYQSSAEWKELTAEIKKAETEVDKYDAKLEQAKAAERSRRDNSIAKKAVDLQKTINKLDAYNTKLKQTQAAEQVKRDNVVAKKSVDLQKAINKLDVYKTKLSEINGAESGIGKKLSYIGDIAKSGFTNITKHASKSNGTLDKLSNSVTRLGKRIWSLLTSALVFSVLTKGFTALREKMAAAVKQNAQFSASMSKISGNMNSAFNNLLSAAMPALNTIISAIAKATSYLSAFIALLTGKTVKSSNTAADAANNQASAIEGVGEAAKKASEYLNPYDEMNVQSSKDSSGGSGGGSGAGSDITYEDVDVSSQVEDFLNRIKEAWEDADFTDFGRIVGDKINDSLENIDWTKIKETSYKIGKSVATFLNGVFETPDLFTNVGKTVAEALNTAINLALGFSENFHWESAGQAIADSINGFFDTFEWDKSGNTVTSIALGILKMIRTAIQQITWESIGADIHTFLANIKWGNILKDIGGLIVDGVCGGIDFLSGLTGIPWENITAGMATIIGTKLGGLSVGLKVGYVVTIAIASYKIGEKIYEKLTGEEAQGGLKDLIDMDVSWSEIGQAISDGAIVDITLTPLFRWISKKTGNKELTTEEIINEMANMIDDAVKNPFNLVLKLAAGVDETFFNGKLKESITSALSRLGSIAYKLGLEICTGVSELKQKVQDKIDGIGKKVVNISADISTKASTLWNDFKKSWGSKTLSAKLGISNSISSLWKSVKNSWNKVKSKLTFPISVPHFVWGSKTINIPILGKKTVPDLNIKWYANGGFPDMGQLFIARERGAEMVGNIGGKTAVANNDQITSAIAAAVGPAVYDAVLSAIANSDGGTRDITVIVGGQKITDYVIKDVKNRTIASGGINPLLV